MIFLAKQTKETTEKYSQLLSLSGSLSRLFSDSEVPFLHYRVAESVFCKAFSVKDLARDDTAYDAQSNNLGIGIKTFISTTGNKLEKVAEFETLSDAVRNLPDKELAVKIAEFRNERIELANRLYGINNAIYHCITRKKDKFLIFEKQYEKINLDRIKGIKKADKTLKFSDDVNEYSFAFSKTTLFQRFLTPKDIFEIDVKILDDPFELLLKFSSEIKPKKAYQGKDFVILPLFSTRGKTKEVPPKSGLNQWNAGGRKRSYGEVYIPVPAYVRNNAKGFFPKRDVIFKLQIPTGDVFDAKICQDDDKALMTNPNSALEQWLLRDILQLPEGKLLNYERLQLLGFDSVRVTKIKDGFYTIDISDSNYSENDEFLDG